MQYIPLADFFGFLGRTVQVVPAAEKPLIAAELKELYASGKAIQTAGKTISLDEAVSFLQLLDHPATVVFDQWAMQYPGLKHLLSGKKLKKNDFDPKIIREHRLFPDFTSYISVFALPPLLKKLGDAEDSDFLDVASYLHLLHADSRLILQEKLSTWLRNKLATVLSAAKKAQTEKSLSQEIGFIVSDEVIAFVNRFDKPFYSIKMSYVDHLLEITTYSACTQRLGVWISGQLKKLQLNPEHLEKISDITASLSREDVRFSNQSVKAAVHFGAMRILTIVGILLIGGIFYLLWFHPFQRSENPELTEMTSSFEQFTKEERMQLDSLIKSISVSRPESTDGWGEDQFLHLPPADMQVIYREPFKNSKAEQFHEDCLRDENLIASGRIDSCATYAPTVVKSKIYPNFQKLADNKGTQAVYLLNESAYQVLVVVFKEERDAPVYAALIDTRDKISFKMNPEEVILFLPGKDWARFQVSSGASSELPSENFKHHFCLQDENFKNMLHAPYQLKTVTQKTVKLMLNESSQMDSDFFLLDLYEALEAM